MEESRLKSNRLVASSISLKQSKEKKGKSRKWKGNERVLLISIIDGGTTLCYLGGTIHHEREREREKKR